MLERRNQLHPNQRLASSSTSLNNLRLLKHPLFFTPTVGHMLGLAHNLASYGVLPWNPLAPRCAELKHNAAKGTSKRSSGPKRDTLSHSPKKQPKEKSFF